MPTAGREWNKTCPSRVGGGLGHESELGESEMFHQCDGSAVVGEDDAAGFAHVAVSAFVKQSGQCEGIENQADCELVAELGCDEIQGYFIAKPMLADEFTRWLIEYEKNNKNYWNYR